MSVSDLGPSVCPNPPCHYRPPTGPRIVPSGRPARRLNFLTGQKASVVGLSNYRLGLPKYAVYSFHSLVQQGEISFSFVFSLFFPPGSVALMSSRPLRIQCMEIKRLAFCPFFSGLSSGLIWIHLDGAPSQICLSM